MSGTLTEKMLGLPEFKGTDFKRNDHDMGFYVETKERPTVWPICGCRRPDPVIYKSRKTLSAYRKSPESRAFETVKKASQSSRPQARINKDKFFPVACTSGKTLCAKRVYFVRRRRSLMAPKCAVRSETPFVKKSHRDFLTS